MSYFLTSVGNVWYTPVANAESSKDFLEVVDEAVGGRVVTSNNAGTRQFWKDLLGKLLTQLNTPLIEGVDVPHGTLGENLHFVQGNKASQCAGGQLVEQEGVGRFVSFEDLVGEELLNGGFVHAGGSEFRTDGIGVLSES